MGNPKRLMEVCIITNGRSTFRFAMQSLIRQKNIQAKIRIVENLDHLSAYQAMIDESQSKFVLRVDDDMFLHPYALTFIHHLLMKLDIGRVALMYWMLYEPWARGVIESIKLYNTELAKRIGFRVDNRGKVDHNFRQDAMKKSHVIKNKSVIAIHACPGSMENLRYMDLRREHRNPEYYRQRLNFLIKFVAPYNVPIAVQFRQSRSLIERINAERSLPFYHFLLKKEGRT